MLEYLKLYLFSLLIKRSESTVGASQFRILKVSMAMVLILRVSRVGKFALVSNSVYHKNGSS